MKEKLKSMKGITLIALVITIIVLLILAGVTIATLTGENGILTKATESKERTTQATAEEMVSVAIGGLQTANLGDTSKITPEAIANQVMEDNNIENVVAEGSTFPTNIIFQDDGVKVGVDIDLSIGSNESYDGIYSEGGLEGKIAPADLFDYEIIDDGAMAATGMDSLPKKTARITRIKPQYCNDGGYNPDTLEKDLEDTNYEIKYDNDVITKESLLVIPYEVDGKYIPNGIEGELYTIKEVNIYVWGKETTLEGAILPKIQTIIFPNTVTKMLGEVVENGTAEVNPILTNVILSNQLEYIGSRAFYFCEALESITIPESVASIGDDAFYGTMWYENQNDGGIYINNILYSYKGDIPEEIKIQEGTTQICGYVFIDEDNLRTVALPDSIKNIGNGVFLRCSSLKNVIYKGVTYTSESEIITILEENGVEVSESSFRNTGLSD